MYIIIHSLTTIYTYLLIKRYSYNTPYISFNPPIPTSPIPPNSPDRVMYKLKSVRSIFPCYT